MAKGGVCAVSYADMWDVCEWGLLCGVRIMAGVFVEGEGAFVPNVYFR